MASGREAVLVIQSREPHPDIMASYPGFEFLPERPTSASIVRAASRPQTRLLCVTAPAPTDAQAQLDYFISLGAPTEGARRAAGARIVLASVDDASPLWLSRKVRGDGRLLETLRAWVSTQRTEGWLPRLHAFEPSHDLEELARALDVELDQAPAAMIPLGSKASSREVLAVAGVPVARGTVEQRTLDDLAVSMVPLVRAGVRDFMLKLSSGTFTSGLGIAPLHLGAGDWEGEGLAGRVRESLPLARVPSSIGGWEGFAAAVAGAGVLAEELLAGTELTSPSFQGILTPSGPQVLATHEQVLTGGQTYSGSTFPARPAYRSEIIDHGLRVGRELHRRGLTVGDYGIDFVAVRDDDGWHVFGCELNLRATGVKHGFELASTLLNTKPDATGRLYWRDEERVYLASDTFTGAGYETLTPGKVIEAVRKSDLMWNPETASGVVVYMLSALAYGKLGVLAVAPDLNRCDQLIHGLRNLLDTLVG